tara:strand:+ start:459 stop:1436 length:978 start_codon:yes stop_codon:yes gene_type:complete
MFTKKNRDYNLIPEYFEEFMKTYENSLKSKVNIINTIISYISKKKGKKLRPSICLLAAKLCGEPNKNTYRAAALLEMIHVATLIHDDVVDEANIRRGWPSVNKIWKNKLSILVGDYMFSKALINMVEIENIKALKILSTTAKRLSEGEILQIEKTIKREMSEEIYYEMISDKTASLFSASCELGCVTVCEDLDKLNALSLFGNKFGMVFQIRDDLLDLIGNIDTLGKPTILDIKKNIQTLPLIYVMNRLDKKEKKEFRKLLNYHIKRTEKNKIVSLIKEQGGVEYAQKQIDRLSNEAREHLEIFPDSVYKTALLSTLSLNTSRMK